MYEVKKINVMSTDTLTPGVEWCNEAYENADIIIYSDLIFKKDYIDKTSSSIYFSNFVITPTGFTLSRVLIKKGSNKISYVGKNIKLN